MEDYYQNQKSDTLEGFTLFECGRNKKIGEWGDLEPCVVRQVKDTLLLGELSYLPVGKNFAQKQVIFFYKQYFYKNKKLTKRVFFNKSLHFYSDEEVKRVFTKYAKLKKGNFEINSDVATMLFWAYVSGSKEAEIKFTQFKINYRPFLDGAVAEDWNITWRNYEKFKRLNP